jgi:hypothetical protein
MTYYFKSCCDSSFTFTLTNYGETLTLGEIWYVVIPNNFSGCCTVVSSLYPNSPTYSALGATLEGFYANCGICTASYVCNRVTGINECDIVTVTPMTISCSPNLINNSITMLVSGGTPPYKIIWSTGTLGPTLSNATANGVYSVTVTDYNWTNGGPDYTATTTCSLMVPSSTPSPTPTPTPTPIPVIYPNLCLQYTINNVTTLYTFIPTGNILNGKPTWSSGTLVIKWGGLSSPYWFVNISGTILQNTNPNTPPIGVWSSFGAPASATSYVGTCNSPVMSLILPNITAPNCVNTSTGSIIVNAINAQPPVLYSKNGGITTQLNNPIFNGLPAGTYSIWVQDGLSNISQQTAIVPNGPATNSYNLTINSTVTQIGLTQYRLTFTIVVRDVNNAIISNLPAGTTITFNLSEDNKFMVATNPAYGSQSQTIQVHKNGVPVGITPTTSSSTQIVSTTNACPPNTQEFSTATTLSYNGITISGADVISGTVITSISKLSPSSCYVKSTDKVYITTSKIVGCTCCNVTGSPQSNVMNIPTR